MADLDPESLPRWLIAFVLAALVAAVAIRLRALTIDGGVAAIVTGTAIVGFAGWRAGILLIAFFATSSLVTKALEPPATSLLERGSRRDAIQVLANGGVPVAFAAITWLTGGHDAWLLATLASIVAAAADTWATGFGRLNRQPPRSIVTWQPVEPGTSGAISPIGTLGSFAAAICLGLPGTWGLDTPGAALIVIPAAVIGSLADSLLGGTMQAQFICPDCDARTERPVHDCGATTTLVRGLAWVSNDVVNGASIALAGLLAAICVSLISH